MKSGLMFFSLQAFSNIRLLMFMLVAWIMGIGIGLIFTFLFWHLQDFGGHPTIFGIASVINHVSEMGAYFYSFKIISQYGHVKVFLTIVNFFSDFLLIFRF